MSQQRLDVMDVFETYYRQEAYRAARLERRRHRAEQVTTSRAAHPLEYDESGFPIPHGKTTVTDRIRSLLGS